VLVKAAAAIYGQFSHAAPGPVTILKRSGHKPLKLTRAQQFNANLLLQKLVARA
jgi:hypothetical protein